MASRTAVITGALGQDGTLLGELLLSQGYRVVGVLRADSSAPTPGSLARAEFVALDLEDPAAVRSLFESYQPSELYHLAAHHHASQQAERGNDLGVKEAMVATNFNATQVLAFTLLQMRLECHLVYASSSQVYRATEYCHLVDESCPRRPASFYGLTKSWSMDLLEVLRKDAGLCASSAILFNHESPRRRVEFVSRKITQAAARAALGMRPAIQLENIGARADWSSARDVAAALSLMGRSTDPRDYVVGSGELRSVRNLLDVAFGHVGLDWAPFVRYAQDTETPALMSCPQVLETALGWRRAVHFEDMVAEMVDSDMASMSASLTRSSGSSPTNG